uniref:C3H1-type domain-containing protein n=1 Tax=Eutreptiella gymnastica TaxID=73025 RepID=A0A7S4LMG3_9EUGL
MSICKYYGRGLTCHKGDNCPFIHPADASELIYRSSPRPRDAEESMAPHKRQRLDGPQPRFNPELHPCLRVRGSCAFGDQCKFALKPRDACLLCLKRREHNVCDNVSTHRSGPKYRPPEARRFYDDSSARTNHPPESSRKLHPCLRLYGKCAFNDTCRFRFEPYEQCLLCLKGKDHVLCDVGLEDASKRQQVEREFVAQPHLHKARTCKNWLTGSCTTMQDCHFLHFLVAPRREHAMPAHPREERRPPPVRQYHNEREDRRPPPRVSEELQHPCIRVYGKCAYGDRCKFANAPRNKCLGCLKDKPHSRCDNESLDAPRSASLHASRPAPEYVPYHQGAPEPEPMPRDSKARQVQDRSRQLESEQQELEIREKELALEEEELELRQRQLELDRKKKALMKRQAEHERERNLSMGDR